MIGILNISKVVKNCFIGVIASILSFCDDTNEYYVPNVPVNIELNLNNELLQLGIGEAVIIEPDTLNDNFGKVIYPYKEIKVYRIPWKVYGTGIIIYRANTSLYMAYDRTCTYLPFTKPCGIVFKENLLLPECPCCGSKFMISANAVATNKSKAERPLLQYHTTLVDNNTRLIISKE